MQTTLPDIFKETFLRVFETLKVFLAAAQKRGFVRGDLEPHLASMFLFGSIFHVFKSDAIGRRYFGFSIADPKFRKNVTESVFRVFSKGLSS